MNKIMQKLKDYQHVIAIGLIVLFGIPSWLTWANIEPVEIEGSKFLTTINSIVSVKPNIFQILLLLSALLLLHYIFRIFKSRTKIYKNRLHYVLLCPIRIMIQNKQVSVIASEPKCKKHHQEVISVRTGGPLSPYMYICPEEGCNAVQVYSDDMNTLREGTQKKEKAIFLAKYKRYY